MLRAFIKTLAWTVLVLVLLVALAFGFLQTGPGKSFVKGIVLDVLNDTFRGRLELDELGGFLPFDAELKGVRAYDPDGQLVLEVATLTADFHPFELFDSMIHLSDVRITKPTVDIFDAKGRMALLRAFEPRTPPTDDAPSPWLVRFEGVRLDEGRIAGLVPGEDLALVDLQLDLSLGLVPEGLRWPNLELRARPVGTSELLAIFGSSDPAAPSTIVVQSRGALVGGELRLEMLDVLAGEHAIATKGSIELEGAQRTDFDILDLKVALDRLPPGLQALLAGPTGTLVRSEVQGRGHLGIDANAHAVLELSLGTPYGLAMLQAAATIRAPGEINLGLYDWVLTLDVADAVAPLAIADRLPSEARATRADIHIEGLGSGLPLADGARMRIEVLVEERAPNEHGKLALVLTRREDDPRDGARSFQVEVSAESLYLQPWLALAGEPALVGELAALQADGTLALPAGGVPRLALALSFDASASGHLLAIDVPVSAPRLNGTANMQWNGVGTPSGRLDIAGVDLGFDLGGARTIELGFDVSARPDGTPELAGTLRATELRWDAMRIATLELPLELVLEGLARGVPRPVGQVRWRATGIDLGAQTIASTSGELRVTAERDGLRVRGPLRTGALDLGRAIDAGARTSELVIDAWLGPGADGVPVGGPISARVSGTVTGARQGQRRVASLHLDDVQVAFPRGPAGIIEVQGKTRCIALAMPEVSADAGSIDLDVSIDPARGVPLGKADVMVVGAVLPDGQRIDTLKLDATAGLDGRIDYQGIATKRRLAGKGPDGKPIDEGVEAHFAGSVTLPGPKRPLDVLVQTLRLRRPGAADDLLVAHEVRYDADGWILLAGLTLRAEPNGGTLELGGRFRPSDGSIDVALAADDVDLPTWFALARDALEWAGKPPLDGVPTELDGAFDLQVQLTGTLAHPRIAADIQLARLTWGERTGAGFKARLRADDQGIALLAALQWHTGGNLSVEMALPARGSLSPPALAWNDDGPMRLALSIDESELAQIFSWADALALTGSPSGAELRTVTGVNDLEGAFRYDLRVDGTPSDPVLRTTFVGRPLDIGDWKNGSLVLEGSARGDASSFRLLMADRDDRTQAQIDIELPFGIARVLRKSDPIGWMRDELRAKPFAIDIDLPRFVIGETPLAMFVPVSIADLAAKVDLTFGGTLERPLLEGTAELGTPEASPVDLGFRLDIGTRDEIVEAYFAAARPNGDPLLDGTLTVPRLGELLQRPSTAPSLLEDPRFAIEIQSADIPSFDFWELNQSIGDLAVQLFPDGRVMLDARGHGSPDGLVASVMTRIRTATPQGLIPPSQADSTVLRRNAADDIRLGVLVGPEAIELNLVMVQDARSVTPFLAIQAAVAVGPRQLITPPKSGLVLADVGIQGRVSAGEFRLEGFASAFRDILGTSGGHLTGDLLISGTVSKPRFAQSLVAQFQPIVVAPLGLEHDWATVTIEFQNGTDWFLTVSELFDESRSTAEGQISRCGIMPPEKGPNAAPESLDYQALPYLTIALSGSIPELDPKKMTLGGCVGLRDYPALAKSDMRGRIDGEIKLAGTIDRPEIRGDLKIIDAVLAPNLASKAVRPIGTPLDVTIVRGAPVPPPVRPPRNPYKLGVLIDVAVSIPSGSTRLEPSLTQLYGEVRALLYPSGELRIRTVGGELGLVGTIDVPKERVLLYGRDFTVDSDSRVVFTGDMTSDPQLFFTARYNIEQIDLSSIGLTTTKESEVVVRVTGTPSQLRLNFSSSPAMDETNILSVIALGVPAGGGEAVGDAVSAQLFTAVMGMATLQFARDFQQRLALDVLRIEARSADPADSRLTVGKRLAEDLILSYYLNLTAKEGEDRSSGTLEYRLTRYLSVLGRGGDAGDVGLELNLRFQD